MNEPSLINIIKKTEENLVSFSKIAWSYIEQKKMKNAVVFGNKTLLSEKTLQRIRKGQLLNPSPETVMALCIGLELGIEGILLFNAAGYNIIGSGRRDFNIYYIILSYWPNIDIHTCNKILSESNCKPISDKRQLK